ncbi:hypothetical protein ABEF95_000462 [Exophiala dermatitidis]
MVLLITTPRILDAISSLSPFERSSLPPLPTTPGSPIEHTSLIALARLLSRSRSRAQTSTHLHHAQIPAKDKDFSLNTLLRGAHVYIPPPPPKPQPSAEYVALMTRLRKDQERREYAALVSKRKHPMDDDDDDEDGKSDEISPSLVLNILLSVVMCAAAMFYLTRWWGNDGLRVLVSLFSGIVVGVAEVTVYAGYLRKVRLSKQKERAKREKKVFIGEYCGEEDSNKIESRPSSAAAEKEEIWGRGVNGGLRRRLRDKWKKEQEQEQKQQAS